MFKTPFIFFLIYLFTAISIHNLLPQVEKHFVYLAHSFLKGSLSLIEIPGSLQDFAYYNGELFSPFGIFPTILLMPFVLIFATSFTESVIKIPLTFLNFWLVYQVSRSLRLSEKKSIWIALFFIFGSIYTPVAAIAYSSSYVPHIIATSLLLLLIWTILSKKSLWAAGIITSLAALTRPTLFLCTVFFLVLFLEKKIVYKSLLKIILPLGISLIIVAYYNFARFDDVFSTGYKWQIVVKHLEERKNTAIFATSYIPENLYYLIFKPPELLTYDQTLIPRPPFLTVNYNGMSIFILSPILFLLFKTRLRDSFIKPSLITVFCLLIPIITYYGIGFKQIGYRYALDFFPFLLIILASAIHKVSESTIKILSLMGIIITWFFIIEYFAEHVPNF